jgi:hypothetical protein
MPPHDRPCAAVHGPDDKATREESFFREVMDASVRAVLSTKDPWEACESVVNVRSAMTDYLVWGMHGGAVFVAWADVEDLCDTGKTPITEAHAALWQAASE